MWRGGVYAPHRSQRVRESAIEGQSPVLWPDISSGSYEFLYSGERGERKMRDGEKGRKGERDKEVNVGCWNEQRQNDRAKARRDV